jgi:DNA recombination protein RmuC
MTLAWIGLLAIVAVFLASLGLASLARTLRAELDRIGRAQDELRLDLQRGREASVRDLSRATEGIRGEIHGAQRVLAEVRALEQGRARQADQAADSLKRLEHVLAGSKSRGSAGENILERAFAQLPPDLIERNASFGAKQVEYALRLPGGKLLPIDSKWPSLASLDRLAVVEDVVERRRLEEQVTRDVTAKAREVAKYLDPDRTLGLGVLAVPDGVHAVAAEAHAAAYRIGVLVVPYSLALPFVLSLYRLSLRFGGGVDTESLASRVRLLDEALGRIDEETEGRLSRALVQIQNARDALREQVAGARRVTDRLMRVAEESGEPVAR